MNVQAHRFSVAPMMDWTDRHCRAFHRMLSRRARLYTEMVTAQAVIYGDRDRLLGFGGTEHPIGLQLGGADPAALAEAASIGADFGYDEINLNVGCPSDRVQSGRFGARLMAEPDLVARSVEAMQRAVTVPVTVKCRIGIDNQDSDRDLDRFISAVAGAGCTTLIVHARKAWLQGLSPKENRDIPPLDYERVHRLKTGRPDLTIVINGGLRTLEEACFHLENLDGVMIGRAAYQNPYLLAHVDRDVFDEPDVPPTRLAVLEAFMPYVEDRISRGVGLHRLTRHVLGLFHGQPGARGFRRVLSEEASRDGAGLEVLEKALDAVRDAAMPPTMPAASL